MKRVLDKNFETKFSKRELLLSAWNNQHPIMFWWFAITTVSLGSVYFMLLTKL